jgi:hypothetical protein
MDHTNAHTWPTRAAISGGIRDRAIRLALTDHPLDSYLIEKGKIYKQALACFMMMAHLRLRRGRRSGLPTVRFISRRVSQHLKPANSFQADK